MEKTREDAPGAPPILEIDSATVVRGDRRVLDDVSMTIRAGEHAAILGPNGSGKSSFIKLLTRQYYPLIRADGAPPVRLFGETLWDVMQLRARMGIVSADLHHAFTDENAGITGTEAVLSGFFGSLGIFQHVITDAMRDAARDALVLADAAHLQNRQMATLSTGEARRILIARALAPDPQTLLLDEPTTGLDLAATHSFLETLRRIADNKTLLLVTHHVHEILPEVERVILMRAGHVFADGTKKDVLTGPTLSALYGCPVEVRPTNTPGYFTAEAQH